MFDVVGIGVLLIDFTPAGKSEQGNTLFEQNPGGDVANMLVAASRLGSKAAFVGKVGNDLFGNTLRDAIEKRGVDSSGLIFSKEYPTTLAFVHLFENGQRDFTFYRDHSADTHLTASEIPEALVSDTRALHFSSLTFTTEEAAEATRKGIRLAREAGAWITYDLNWRPMLWKSEKIGIEGMSEGIGYATVVKLSEEELELVTGKSGESGVNQLFDRGVKLVLLTMGAKGAKAITPGLSVFHDTYNDVKPIDTTGAGDACFGAFLHTLLQTGANLDDLSREELIEAVRFANATASICVTRMGAMPAMPTKKEVDKFLREQWDKAYFV